MKLLFIARTYPPLIGGIEKFSEDYYNHIKESFHTDLLANKKGKKGLLFFFLKLLFYLMINSKNYDIIHFSDAILAPVFPVIRLFSKAKICVTVHGLDIIYNKWAYQYWNPPFLCIADRIFPVSEYTKKQCVNRGIPETKLEVIHNGIDLSCNNDYSLQDNPQLIKKFDLESNAKILLLTVGRLIKRKGHQWFIKNVMPKLGTGYIYLIAGEGPEYSNLFDTITEYNLHSQIKLLGYVTEEEKFFLLKHADFFIMPNIKIEGDQEGFGIVLIEAGYLSVPVIASRIEGITDAVLEGETGNLIESENVQGFINAIVNNSIERSKISEKTIEAFNWNHIRECYVNAFYKIIGQKKFF